MSSDKKTGLNKNKPDVNELNVEFKKASDEPIQTTVQKTKEQIEIENNQTIFQQDVLSGSINNDLGKFTKKTEPITQKIPQNNFVESSEPTLTSKSKEVLSNVTTKVKSSQNRIKSFLNSIKHALSKKDKKAVSNLANKSEIDFEKFSKTKQTKLRQFNVKVDIMLRNNKYLLWTWLVIFGVLILVLATQISFIVTLNAENVSQGPLAASNFIPYLGMRQASIILSYIALCAPIAPFVFLITCWFIGINGVYRARTFHYFLWVTLIISVLCMITDIIMASIVIDAVNSFHAP